MVIERERRDENAESRRTQTKRAATPPDDVARDTRDCHGARRRPETQQRGQGMRRARAPPLRPCGVVPVTGAAICPAETDRADGPPRDRRRAGARFPDQNNNAIFYLFIFFSRLLSTISTHSIMCAVFCFLTTVNLKTTFLVERYSRRDSNRIFVKSEQV